MLKDFEYDVAFSYASEERSYVRKVAIDLCENGVNVFYDEFEEEKLWGENLQEYLDEVYQNKSKYVVVFISASYAEKEWTNYEKKSALARALRESRSYILPYNFDGTILSGIPPTLRYISDKKPEELSYLINKKINGTSANKEKRTLVKAVSTNLSVIIYRVLCLIYVNKSLDGFYDKLKLKKIYKIINHDLNSKIGVLDKFPDQLNEEERSSLFLIKQNAHSLTVRERNLDSLFKSLAESAICIVKGIPNLSFHKDDKEWYEINGGEINIIKKSNAFALLFIELEEFEESSENKNTITSHPDYLKYYVPFIAKRVIYSIESG